MGCRVWMICMPDAQESLLSRRLLLLLKATLSSDRTNSQNEGCNLNLKCTEPSQGTSIQTAVALTSLFSRKPSPLTLRHWMVFTSTSMPAMLMQAMAPSALENARGPSPNQPWYTSISFAFNVGDVLLKNEGGTLQSSWSSTSLTSREMTSMSFMAGNDPPITKGLLIWVTRESTIEQHTCCNSSSIDGNRSSQASLYSWSLAACLAASTLCSSSSLSFSAAASAASLSAFNLKARISLQGHCSIYTYSFSMPCRENLLVNWAVLISISHKKMVDRHECSSCNKGMQETIFFGNLLVHIDNNIDNKCLLLWYGHGWSRIKIHFVPLRRLLQFLDKAAMLELLWWQQSCRLCQDDDQLLAEEMWAEQDSIVVHESYQDVPSNTLQWHQSDGWKIVLKLKAIESHSGKPLIDWLYGLLQSINVGSGINPYIFLEWYDHTRVPLWAFFFVGPVLTTLESATKNEMRHWQVLVVVWTNFHWNSKVESAKPFVGKIQRVQHDRCTSLFNHLGNGDGQRAIGTWWQLKMAHRDIMP